MKQLVKYRVLTELSGWSGTLEVELCFGLFPKGNASCFALLVGAAKRITIDWLKIHEFPMNSTPNLVSPRLQVKPLDRIASN